MMADHTGAKLVGKVAFVTAAGQGIGRAAAEALAQAGAKVFATDINDALLLEVGSVDGITAMKLDALDSQAVKDAVAEAGVIDILFNCAGFVHSGTVLDATDEDMDFAFNLNVKAMMRTIKAVLPGMLERGDGVIINMASVASSIKGVPNRFVYSLTKAAVIGLTKSVAADYIGHGIRCHAICPGTVDSPSLHGRLRASGDYEKAMKDFISRQPVGRLGRAEEIGDLVAYLAGATYTTGQVQIIDGGWAL